MGGELSEFDIKFKSRSLIKVQILLDVLVECTIPNELTEPDEVEIHV